MRFKLLASTATSFSVISLYFDWLLVANLPLVSEKIKAASREKDKKKNIEKKSFFLSRFMAWKSQAQPVRQSCLLFTSCLCWPFLWSSTYGHIQFSANTTPSPIKANSESSFQRVFLLPRLFSFCCISIYLCQLCSS